MAELFTFPACILTFLIILVFIKFQSWMQNTGLPIPEISPQIGNLSSSHDFLDDESVNHVSPDHSIFVVNDKGQENPEKLEECNIADDSSVFLGFIPIKTIQDRQEKMRSSIFGEPVMINDVITSSFKDLISKIREMIGEESEASVQIYEILSKYIVKIFLDFLHERFYRNVFEVTGAHILSSVFEARDFYSNSASICYFLYHLSRDKQLQDRIRKEIIGKISEIDNLPKITFKELSEKMPIFTAAILETCRLTPSSRQWSMNQDDRLAGFKVDDLVLQKGTNYIVAEFEPSASSCDRWGENAAIFKLERFLIIKDSGLQIDYKAVEKLMDESFLLIESGLDKLFAFQQFMIGSVLLLDAFEFSGTHQLGMAGSNQPQQSWFDIAVTSSLTVSYAKN